MKNQSIVPSSFLEEEKRPLLVHSSTKKMWACLIEMVMAFDSLCRRYDISYVADGGTMLGVERHRGFIPWDDDIDIIMKRDEYEKLLAHARELPEPYFLQEFHSDPMACRGHAQLRNSRTTAILKCETRNGIPLYTFNQGVFADIFIMDSVPDDDDEATRFMEMLERKKLELVAIRDAYASSFGCCLRLKRHGMKLLWIKIISRLFDLSHSETLLVRRCREFDRACQKYNGTGTKRFSHLTYQPNPAKRYLFDSTILDERVYKPFEMVELPVPVRADEYLTQLHGDWHRHVVAPPMHGGLIVDLDKPYTEYLKK